MDLLSKTPGIWGKSRSFGVLGSQARVAGTLSYLDFASASVTLTPGAAIRTAPGPFDAAPIVQGKWDASGTGDVVSLSRGTLVGGAFYTNLDGNQGAISAFLTPERVNGSVEQTILYSGTDLYFRINTSNQLELHVGGQAVTVDVSGWTVATTYKVLARWDCDNTLDGTNYLSISVNDSHTFGGTSAPSAPTPGATLYVGSNNGATPINAIVEGLTIYRRVLWDGTYGTNVGNGDEVALIYASGSGKDPCELSGSWDVTLAVPTNQTVGTLATTGQAWTHPHASNALTDGFGFTTYGSSGWSTKGTPSTGPADMTATEKVYGGGYQWTADADAEGVSQSLTSLTAGQNYVLRGVAHTDTADSIRVLVYDDTNSAAITTYTFGASSTRTAPGIPHITFELPTVARNGVGSDCTAITVSVEATAASQTVYLHQIELLVNLVDNPSMETGAGDPWVPDGWANSGTADAGELIRNTTSYHSGASSLELSISGSYQGVTISPATTAGRYVSLGVWGYNVSGTFNMVWMANTNDGSKQSKSAVFGQSYISGASWKHYPWVIRQNTTQTLRLLSINGNCYFDDVYMVALTGVTLTVTPASAANSAEASGLRVDGRDTCTQAITNLTATSGHIRFKWTPRHSAANFVKFLETYASIASFDNGANYILLYMSAANTIRVQWNDGGGAVNANWDCTGAIVAGTTYLMQIDYDASGVTLTVDGTLRATAAGALDFGASVPSTAHWGTWTDNAHAGDATFAAPR